MASLARNDRTHALLVQVFASRRCSARMSESQRASAVSKRHHDSMCMPLILNRLPSISVLRPTKCQLFGS